MGFVVPILLGLAALTALIVLLHIQRRRSVTVPSLIIWQKLRSQTSGRQRVFQWPRPSWILFLQLAFVLLVAFALAQPLIGNPDEREHWIVVADRSQGMGIEGPAGTSALEAGIDRALTLIDAQSINLAAVSVVSAGAVAEIAAARTADPEAALTALQPTNSEADWSGAARLVGLLADGSATPRILVITDGPLPDAFTSVIGDASLTTLSEPRSTHTVLTASLAPGREDEVVLSGTVAFAPDLLGAELIVTFTPQGATAPLPWTERALAARLDGAPTTFSVNLELPGPGIVSASLDGDSAAGVYTYEIADGARSLDVLYIGPGAQPLVRALQAVNGVTVYQAEGLPDDVSRFALVVVDDVEVARQPETSTVFIGTGHVAGEAVPEPVGVVTPDAWDGQHALGRGIAFNAVLSIDAVALTASAGEEVILSAQGNPLMTATTGEHGRIVRLGFNPSREVWSDQSGFPQLAFNLANWLGPLPSDGRIVPFCVTGEACRFDARLIGGTATLAGTDTALPLDASGIFIPETSGLYTLARDGRSAQIAVNARPATPVPAVEASLANAPPPAPVVLWPWLAGFAVLALLAETLIAGRGPERFLTALGLSGANPLAIRRRLMLGLRLATIVFAGAALFNLPLFAPVGRDSVVIAGNSETAQAALANAAQTAGTAPVVVAGSSDALAPAPADTLGLASALAAQSENGRVVLSGPLPASVDDVAAAAQQLAARGITVDVALAEGPAGIAVTGVEAPSPVFTGDTFPLSAMVYSPEAQSAVVRILRDGIATFELPVDLVAGQNRVESYVEDIGEEPALFEFEIVGADSAASRNGLFVEPREPGRVLIVAQDVFQGAFFGRMLRAQGLTVVAITPNRAPTSLNGWLDYDDIVLMNVPAIGMSTRQQNLLRNAVSEHGRGLMILGGPNTFGPGGYLQTPLDEMSPLSSNIPREAPEVAMAFVLDRSGSMQQPVGSSTRLDIAKAATQAAVSLLNPESQVSIVVFDEAGTVILPMQDVGDGAAANAAIRGLNTGGGTSIYPGLEQALEQFAGVEAEAKHVVVMTDGLTQPADFPGLLEQFAAQDITVSSVAIGQGAALEVVEAIASLGQGTFHATQDFEALPSILSQEALLLSGSAIEEGETDPVWVSRDQPFLLQLPNELPSIEAFVLTTPKPEAEVSLAVTDTRGELLPLLASWRYGNGQVMAFTTEAVGPWSAGWQDLEAYPLLWSQAARQFLPATETQSLRIASERAGDRIEITLDRGLVDGAYPDGLPELQLTGGEGTAVPLTLAPSSVDGRFTATAYPTEPGNYLISATDGPLTAESRVHIAYPQRLDPTANSAGLAYLAQATGGQVYAPGTTPDLSGPARWIGIVGWPFWLGVALALFMAEMLLRYSATAQRLLAPRRVPAAPVPPASTETPARPRQTQATTEREFA